MTKRKLYLALQAAVCVALVVWMSLSAVGIYLEGSARRAEHPMESIFTPQAVADRFAPIAPLCFAGLGLLVAGLILGVKDESSGRKRLKHERSAGIVAQAVDPPKRTGILQAVVIVAALLLILAGVLNGSARDVLYKAITICTECVGLG